MTPRPRPPAPRPFPVLTVHVTASTPRPDWCHLCKAWTRFTGDVLLLTPDGVSVVGSYAGCEICDEPDDPEETRRV
ncbi:hypothetical protein [Streptomyces variabilis]